MKQAHEKNSSPNPVDHGLAYNQGLNVTKKKYIPASVEIKFNAL